MKIVQKILISLLLAVLVFTGFAVAAYSGLFDILDTRFYNQRVRDNALQLLEEARAETEAYQRELREAIGAYGSLPAMRNVFLINQSREDTEAQALATGRLFDQYPEIDYLRIIDSERGNLWFSTLEEDVRTRQPTRIEYLTVEELDPPLQIPSAGEERPGLVWTRDPAALRVLVPVQDNFNIPRGLLVAWASPAGIYNRLQAEGILSPATRVRLTPQGYLVFNARRHFEMEDLEALDQALSGDQVLPVVRSQLGESYALETLPATETLPPSVILINENDLYMDRSLQLILLGAVFLVTFIIAYLILNIRQDPALIVSERFRRFQQAVIRDYLREGRAVDPEIWKRELDSRRDQIEHQIRRGIGKLNEEQKSRVEQDIGRNWDEMYRLMGSVGADRPARIEPINLAQIEEIIEKTLARYGQFAEREGREPGLKPEPKRERRTPRKAPEPEEEKPETTIARDPFAGMKPVEVEEIEELEAEEPEALEEMEELEPEALEELDELEAEAGEPEALEEIEEIEPEALEEIDELEAEPEALEEIDELEAEPVEPEALEEIEELEPEALEELDELEVEAGEPEALEEIEELEPEALEEIDELEAEPVEPEALEEIEELEPESLEEIDELEAEPVEPDALDEIEVVEEWEVKATGSLSEDASSLFEIGTTALEMEELDQGEQPVASAAAAGHSGSEDVGVSLPETAADLEAEALDEELLEAEPLEVEALEATPLDEEPLEVEALDEEPQEAEPEEFPELATYDDDTDADAVFDAQEVSYFARQSLISPFSFESRTTPAATVYPEEAEPRRVGVFPTGGGGDDTGIRIGGPQITVAYHVVEIEEFVAMSQASHSVIDERNGLVQIDSGAFFTDPSDLDHRVQVLADQVINHSHVETIDSVFGSAFDDLDFGDILNASDEQTTPRSPDIPDQREVPLRLGAEGFELTASLDNSDTGIRQVYRQLVRLTGLWDARAAMILEQGSDGVIR
ncbi:MAG: hypothetical protein EA427_08520, partial [Spirochaetaceae bacterium]